MRKRVRVFSLLGAWLLPMLLVSPQPAGAVTQMLSGGGVWGGTVQLAVYPCTGGCAFGGFQGYFAGTMQVVTSSGIPSYTAVWPSGTAYNLSVGGSGSYKEDCGIVLGIPLSGLASDSFTVSGGIMMLNGGVVGTATLTGFVNLEQTGPIIIIGVTGVSLLLNGTTTVATSSSGGLGVGIIGPPIEGTSDMPLPPSCSHQVPVTVALAGTYTEPE